MNILHLNPELNITCGVSKTIFNICKGLNSDAQHLVICFGGDAVDDYKKSGLQIIVIPKFKSVLSYPNLLFYIIKFVHSNKIDLLHSHHRVFDSISSLVKKITKVKTVTSVHSKVLGKKMLSYRADKLIAVSENIKDHLVNYFRKPEDKIEVINNFVVEDHFIDDFVSESFENGGTNIRNIIFIGRLSLEKGVDILLQAFNNICKTYPQEKFALQLVGTGPLIDYCTNYSKENNLFVKIIEPTLNVKPFYKMADVIVLPSRVDPFPLVVLESGIMSKPFVGTDVDGISEVITTEEEGILTIPENPIVLAKAIYKVVTNKILADKFANNLHAKVKKYYTADKILPKYEYLYRKLLNE